MNGFPTMLFNGTESVRGASSVSSSYERYKAVLSQEMAKTNSLIIKAEMISIGNKISLDISVTNISNNGITGVKLMVVVYVDLNTDAHHYVVRDMLPPKIISISSQQQQTFNLTADYSSGSSNLKAVVFLQSSSRQVLQSTLATAR